MATLYSTSFPKKAPMSESKPSPARFPLIPFFVFALQLLFVGLKLGGCITWSWWLVMLPLIIWLGLSVCVGLMMGAVFVIGAIAAVIVLALSNNRR